MPHVAISGATGHIGGAVAQILSNAEVPARLLVRDPSRAPKLPHTEVMRAQYEYVPECVTALTGIDTVFMVSIVDGSDQLLTHQDFIDAAMKAGVRQVVYLSFVGAAEDSPQPYARTHGATESYLGASGLDVTVVRSNYFAEALLHFHQDGYIRGPAGDGRIAAVARQDVAAAVAAVMMNPTSHVGKTYELTGPEAVDFHGIADIFSHVLGEDCTYVAEIDADAHANRLHYGAPPEVLDAWLSAYVSVRHGTHGHVTGDVEHLTGQLPTSTEDTLSRLQE